MSKYIPKTPALVGPPGTKANGYVAKRLQEACVECEFCWEPWHFKAVCRPGMAVQTNVGGQVMSVRKAMYMAFFPEKRIQKNRRITSRCRNPNCINPALLVQSTPSDLLKSHYVKGIRDRKLAAAHLVQQQRKNRRLSDADVLAIISDSRKGKEAAHEWGISKEHYNAIQRGASRKPSNPFAGLIR